MQINLSINNRGHSLRLYVICINNQIDCNKCTDICIDGSKFMTEKTCRYHGSYNDCTRNIYKWSLQFADMHSQLKKTPKSLISVLNSAVQAVNYVKVQPYNSRLFKMLCNDTGSKCKALILHTEFRWLSRSKVLLTVFQLSEEL